MGKNNNNYNNEGTDRYGANQIILSDPNTVSSVV